MIINEIFASIDGEVNKYHQGHLTTFVRMAGCDLKCSYCDTEYAQREDQGKQMVIEQVRDKIYKIGLRKITFTGGEPLMQAEELEKLIFMLMADVDNNIDRITIETNGSFLPMKILRPFVSWIMDWKLWSSGMNGKMDINNFIELDKRDWVKFVIMNYDDYEDAKEVMKELKEYNDVNFAMSSVFGKIEVKQLMDWMIADKLDVILNVQIHKLIGLK